MSDGHTQTAPPAMAAGTTYHITLDLRWVLRAKDREIRNMLVDAQTGRTLTPEECRDLAIERLREGFEVLPRCDHHDAKGHCLGHPPAEATTKENV